MYSAEAAASKLVHYSREDEYKDYFETTTTGILYLDSNGRIKNLNREAERICGVDRKRALGKQAEQVFQDFGYKFLKVFSPADCDNLYTTSVRINVNEQALYLHINALKLTGSNGEMTGMIVILQDVSAVRAAIKQIQTTQMLVSLGELAAGVAHHVRTPLTTLSGYLQVMLGRLENDQYTVKRDTLEVLLDEVSYINDVVKELVLFAKPPVNKEPQVDINRILHEALLLTFKDLGGEKINIHKQLATNLPLVALDVNLVKQAVVNIMQNSLEAMAEEGTLTVKSWLNSELNMLVIGIYDTGNGIPTEILSRIFEPFYTTKLDRMGLGLPIAHRIISEHGGFIHVNADEQGGTKVKIYLPIVDDRLRRLTVVHQQLLNLQ
ncbi:two-component system sensor histidine kinase NtrB [Propionispora vibrioides]|uniref:histidine kinase n=1 Tax=Propionispora vibrioides TaxID=112903 RepID=A0A1H8Q4D5_9FIRM|nr:ATP-binding protein [Propionispora vibrioides]SEO49112.1 two-component system, NtrC family, sensor histidine kinase AtoS [Propionispora vibrioides]